MTDIHPRKARKKTTKKDKVAKRNKIVAISPEKYLKVPAVLLLENREKVALWSYFSDPQVYYSGDRVAGLAGHTGAQRYMSVWGRNVLTPLGRARHEVAEKFKLRKIHHSVARATNKMEWSYQTWLDHLPPVLRSLWLEEWIPSIGAIVPNSAGFKATEEAPRATPKNTKNDPVEVSLSTHVKPDPIPVPIAEVHDTTPMGVEEVHGMLSALARRIREPAVCLAATKQLLDLWKQFPDRANPNKEASREVLYATKDDIVNELRSRYRSKQKELGINLSFKDPIVEPVIEEPKDPEKLN